jgi:hypothetical protein
MEPIIRHPLAPRELPFWARITLKAALGVCLALFAREAATLFQRWR